MSLTFTDLFCGAGGSSLGLAGAGLELVLAANHWDRAIETHAANFPDAEHLCEDVNRVDMRRLPATDVLWGSPICTEATPAGGRPARRRPSAGQLDLLADGPVAQAGFERTRATFHDVIRAAEVHRYTAVLVENVVEVAWRWELFDWWCDGMTRLGYRLQVVCVSSAHVGGPGNPWAPQWRDRLYLVFTRAGAPAPDVAPRPAAWCASCGADVAAVQSWKPGAHRVAGGHPVGKYRQQYVYRCPNTACAHAVVEPYVLPAAAAIDWTDLGQRIGDRRRPLAPNTLRRIEAGLRLFAAEPGFLAPAGGTWNTAPAALDGPLRTRTAREAEGLAVPPFVVRGCGTDPAGSAYLRAWPAAAEPLGSRLTSNVDGLVCAPFAVNVNHHGDEGRPYPVDGAPLPPRTAKIGDGVVVPPFVTMLRNNGTTTGIDEPLATVTTGSRRGGGHHYLTVPSGAFYTKHFTPRGDGGWAGLSKDAWTEPLGAITAADHHSLVVPYYRTGRAKTTAAPLDTCTARDRFALVDPAVAVEDCRFRMLQPREHLRAQRFPDDYEVKGNRGEQTMQAGNAVSANVAHWLGAQLLAALDGSAA